MDEHERRLLLGRIEREGATVGHSIPQTVSLGDDEFALQDFVFETKRQDIVTQERRDKVEKVRRTLRRARNNRITRIEEGDLSRKEGEAIVDEVIGIDRALSALEDLSDDADVETKIKRQEVADKRRWMNFIEDALDSDGN